MQPAILVAQSSAEIAAGTPLYVRTTKGTPLRLGGTVQAVLAKPLWVKSQLVFPEGATLRGIVVGLMPIAHEEHLRALLDGDFTLQKMPLVDFDSVDVGDRTYHLHTDARMQKIEIVRFVAAPKRSLMHKAISLAKEKINEEYNMVFGPEKMDRAMRLFYSQLPYHPQHIWFGTEFVADLISTEHIDLAPTATLQQVSDDQIAKLLPPGTVVEARLETPLSSDNAKRGDAVKAILTEPIFSGTHQVLLAEGAELDGMVQQAKASGSFGHNGRLRFSFNRTRQEGSQQLYGNVAGAASNGRAQNVKVDAEGEVRAQPENNRFIAPLILGVLAAHGLDDDGGAGAQVTASNGFGLIARILSVSLGNRNVATGFGAYGFAKSVYFRFVARGHAVVFSKDTPLEVQLSSR